MFFSRDGWQSEAQFFFILFVFFYFRLYKEVLKVA